MDMDDIINRIDQLHADIGDVFGRNSDTYRAMKKLYDLACKEAEEIEEHRGEPSDAEEYAAAHAAGRIADARSINAAR